MLKFSLSSWFDLDLSDLSTIDSSVGFVLEGSLLFQIVVKSNKNSHHTSNQKSTKAQKKSENGPH